MPAILIIFQVLIAALALIVGWFSIFKTTLVLKWQQDFYRRINWRIEPVSLTKEIRNTKIMGLLDVILGSLILALLFKTLQF